ncbi:Suppressor of fused protein (SUFU) [compost metagenome]
MGLFNKRKEEIPTAKTPVEKYLQHLDAIFQREPEFFKNDSLIEGLPGVTSIVYRDIPEKGYITALTYGLSLVKHPDWKFGRPELCISVESSHNSWALIAGYVANHLRGDCPFSYSQTINFGERISEDSEMDAFFVFAPSTLDKEDYLDIDIGLDYKINIAGLYPMYSEELEAYEKMGLEAFWHHPDFDNYSVNRKRIAL